MVFDYKNILIYGYSKSGKAVENVLKDINANYKIYDKNIKIQGGEFLLKLNKKILQNFDLIVISPGVSIYDKYIKIAEKLNIKVISELEFGFWFTSAEIIAVTGTNGKTTTVNLINQVLKLAGYKSDAYGNIGTPLSEAYKKDYDYIVCEVSSFQLEATDKFVAKIGVLLNIAPDHIDRHKNFNNYISCKRGLFKNCKTTDYAVIGNNDIHCVKISKEIVSNIVTYGKSDANIIKKECDIYKNCKKICKINKKLQKFTYFDNILAVIAVMDILNIDCDLINKVELPKHNPHRLETFLISDGVTYINDSKATNIHSVVKALEIVKDNVILLLGGVNKKILFKEFACNLPTNISKVITFGYSGKEIAKAFKGCDVEYYKTLQEATEYACEIAKKGDVVLLSPACASFDEFSGYAERGDFFKKCVIDKVKKYGKTKK